MSWFTVGEIALWLLIAVILGVILGWLLRGLRAGRNDAGADGEAALRSRIASLEAELALCRESSQAAPNPIVATPLVDAEPEKIAEDDVEEPAIADDRTDNSVDSSTENSTDASIPAPASETAASPAEAQARVAEIAVRTGGGDTVSDNLQRIHGIGPKIDGLLRSMGIISFQQVARFTPADIADVTAALEVFPGRIERDGWLASARQLSIDTHGKDPLA